MSDDKLCMHAMWESQCPVCRAFTLTKAVSPNDFGAIPDKSIQGSTGWVCPVCGGGNSPYATHCPCKPVPIAPVTCAHSGLLNTTICSDCGSANTKCVGRSPNLAYDCLNCGHQWEKANE